MTADDTMWEFWSMRIPLQCVLGIWKIFLDGWIDNKNFSVAGVCHSLLWEENPQSFFVGRSLFSKRVNASSVLHCSVDSSIHLEASLIRQQRPFAGIRGRGGGYILFCRSSLLPTHPGVDLTGHFPCQRDFPSVNEDQIMHFRGRKVVHRSILGACMEDWQVSYVTVVA